MDFVLDCSLTMAWFFEDEYTPFTTAVRRSLDGENQAYVPSIWPLEVGNAFLVSERRKRITPDKTALFLSHLKILPIRVEESPSFSILRGIMNLAREYRLSTYDAAYLELAVRNGFPLASLDKDLLRAAEKCGVRRMDENDL